MLRPMPTPLLKLISDRPFLLDGAMGATLQNLELTVDEDYLGHENCVDLLVRSRPELIQSIHERFLEVGADAVETDTFGANPLVLAEFDSDLTTWAVDLNREAAEIARAACERWSSSDQPRFVFGSMGPGTRLVSLGQVSWEEMTASYQTQASGLLLGGVDAFLIETAQDLLQVKSAINGCLAALEAHGGSPHATPIFVSLTIETSGTMLLGSDITTAVTALRSYPIAGLGLNCATGPAEMLPHVAYLCRHWDRAVSCIPNAGLPVLVEGSTRFPLGPDQMADSVKALLEMGVNIFGGCCGTGADHIARLAALLRGGTPGSRQPESPPDSCSSLYSTTPYRQEQSFFIVGERMNASGSRKFKRLLEEENIDEMVSLARQQAREGANCLDINVDYAGRSGPDDMAQIVSEVVRQVDAPIMIDSTQPAVMEAGLRHMGGRGIINSANFEDGDEKFDHMCSLAATYGAALVIGTIDEDPADAMARTADRKFEIARRGIARATEVHGLAVGDLFIDPLVLPVSTGMDTDRRSSLELVEGVRRIASTWPDVQITCGLSNCSFGLKPAARQVLNSVLLWELMDAGLTSAIVHASKIQPMNRIDAVRKQAALDVIYDRRALTHGGTGLPSGVSDESHDPLQAFIDLFDDDTSEEAEALAIERSLEELLRAHIVDGEKRGLESHLDQAMEQYSALEIINDHLLVGMKTVGDLFGSGQMQLPFVLQSAEVMKRAVGYLEPHMDRIDGASKGRIVLATVKGDVHDIGKNLVDIILTNNGWTVENIGIKRTIDEIVQAWRRTGADAIGMSGLLVKSVMVMEDNLRALNELAIDVPVLLGGAALSRTYCESHLREVYQGRVYYGKDAFDGLRICDAMAAGQARALDAEIDRRRSRRAAAEARVDHMEAAERHEGEVATIEPGRSDVSQEVAIPTPPFWGSRVVSDVPLDEVYPYVNTTALFRGQWGFRRGQRSRGDFHRLLHEEAEPVFERLKESMGAEGVLRPALVYGWYPCGADGDDLVIFDPEDHAMEIERFSFPRQAKRRRLCISDFFRGVEEADRDVVGLSCVTMGSQVSELAGRLFEKDSYTEYLYVHGMGVECAEALAEYWHCRMRQELGLGADDSPHVTELFQQKYRGSRYSFGYPACPNMADQQKLFRLLDPARIGCQLTENWQIDPEQSTSAIIVHHPEAKYFNV